MSVFYGQYVVSANMMSLSRIFKQLSGAILMIVFKEHIGAFGIWALVIEQLNSVRCFMAMVVSGSLSVAYNCCF